jgi:hypothetical protein
MNKTFNLTILKEKRINMSGSIVTNEEMLYSNMLEIQAIIRILINKGITTEKEILEEVEKFRDEVNDKVSKMGKEN